MSVMTVTGPVETDSLGITLAHEHLFIDLRNQFTEFSDPEKRRISRQKVCMENLGILRFNPYAIKDNLLIDQFDVVVNEVDFFKKMGGKTIVECTSVGIKRNVRQLRQLALRTGLNIIAGSGYYTHDTHPEQMELWSVEEIAEQIVCDLVEGVDGTEIKAGIIGEIGTSQPLHPNERKSLLAAAIASNKTGAPVYVHTYPWGREGLVAVDLLVSNGVNPGKIVICHLDVEPDIDYVKEVLSKGVFLEFDNFGKEFYIHPKDRGFAGGIFIRDIERVKLIRELIEAGYERQILVTNDICLKMMLHTYGGCGYDHILRNIVPMMSDEGIGREKINLFLKENPKKLFL